MSRSNNGYKSISGTVGANFGDTLRDDMVANAALFTAGGWTIGAEQIFGTTTEERKYWVLTHGTSNAEILFMMNNGTSASYDDGVHSSYRSALFGNFNQQMGVAYAKDGGYAASFGSAKDPANADFWPASSSTMQRIGQVLGGNAIEFWFIVDSSRAELTMYVRDTGNKAWNMLLCGDAIYDNTYDTSRMTETCGILQLYGWNTTTTQPLRIQYSEYGFMSAVNTWTYDSVINFAGNEFRNSSVLTDIDDNNQPTPDTKYSASDKVPLVTPEYINGHITGEHMRVCGRTNTDTFRTLRGTSTNFKLVHLFEDLWTPWDNNLAAPAA